MAEIEEKQPAPVAETPLPTKSDAPAENPASTSTLEAQNNALQQSFLPEDKEVLLAKSYLTTKVGVKHPISLYDHLTSMIMQSLETRNTNIVGILD